MRRKVFNLYFLFFMTSGLYKPRVSLRRKMKRTIVVLKSPFHYKTPKHHIQYSFLVAHCSFSVPLAYAKQACVLMSEFFIQNKPHRLQLKSPEIINLESLVL